MRRRKRNIWDAKPAEDGPIKVARDRLQESVTATLRRTFRADRGARVCQWEGTEESHGRQKSGDDSCKHAHVLRLQVVRTGGDYDGKATVLDTRITSQR